MKTPVHFSRRIVHKSADKDSENLAVCPPLPCVSWQPVSTPPDAETTVLLYMPKADEPIWLGYLDFDEEKPLWRDVSGVGLRGRFVPTHWAHLPEPPKGK